MFITLKYIRKNIIAHSARMKRMTARTGFFFQTFPIVVFLLIPIANPNMPIVLTGLDYTIFIFLGASCLINIIAAILYKVPQKKQSAF